MYCNSQSPQNTMDRSLLSASSSSSSSSLSSSSSSSSSLILFTCLGSVIAFGSVLIFVRRVFNPRNNDGDEDADSENINNNNNNNAIELERFDVNIGLGINRFRLDLNLLFQVRSQLLENAQQSRRRVNLYVRIGGNYPHEIVALLLLLLRSQAAPILMPLLEDVEFAAISYLRTLRRPRFACRIA
ncbi:hypothetical protein LOK49_LG02G03649 [Camellia lanceoleosa]|uniref:Uncharacterized protein n=1 Tax=Camellia lanceoleosa TaxID=1840588 RepID=A0ACC0IPF2_9ERIC|nr:hypothetical protein LOK49_LG02G03649 [Camellia lanceoleosa]